MPVGHHLRRGANGPTAQPLRTLTGAVEHAHRSHPAEAGTPVGTIESGEAAARHGSKNRVVHDLARAGTVLDAAHPLVFGEPRRDHEVAEDIRTGRTHVEPGGHLEHEVGLCPAATQRQ